MSHVSHILNYERNEEAKVTGQYGCCIPQVCSTLLFVFNPDVNW